MPLGISVCIFGNHCNKEKFVLRERNLFQESEISAYVRTKKAHSIETCASPEVKYSCQTFKYFVCRELSCYGWPVLFIYSWKLLLGFVILMDAIINCFNGEIRQKRQLTFRILLGLVSWRMSQNCGKTLTIGIDRGLWYRVWLQSLIYECWSRRWLFEWNTFLYKF